MNCMTELKGHEPMKRMIFVLLLCVVFASILIGCGEKCVSEGVSEPNVTDQNDDINGSEESLSEIASEVSESDFEYHDNGDGTCAVIACNSTADIIAVPETLNGLTVTSIEDNAFHSVPAEKIILPDTTEYIGTAAFFECEDLREVDLGTGLLRAGNKSFMGCPALESVTFPDGMTTIRIWTVCQSARSVYTHQRNRNRRNYSSDILPKHCSCDTGRICS